MPEASNVKDTGVSGDAATDNASEALTHLTAHRMPQLPDYEKVNHPSHYGGDTTYEAIKVIEAWDVGFNVGSALKYLARAGAKPGSTYLEDLRKAAWYLQREIDKAEG